MTVVRAHFDGKVFVPDDPINLRPGNVTLQVVELEMDTHPLTDLPVLRTPEGTKVITVDDVERAMAEDA